MRYSLDNREKAGRLGTILSAPAILRKLPLSWVSLSFL